MLWKVSEKVLKFVETTQTVIAERDYTMPLWYTKNYTPTPHFPFEKFLRDAEKILNDPFSQESASKYPLTNIGYAGNTLLFEIALAGFKKENITVSYVGNVITVIAKWKSSDGSGTCCGNCCGTETQETQETQDSQEHCCETSSKCCCCHCEDIQYIQKNISTKDVCRKFYLSNEYLGGSIKWKYVDGLLTIAVYLNEVDHSVQPSGDDEDLIPPCPCPCCND